MAAPLHTSDILDLVKGTLRQLGRMKFQQIAQDIQDFEVFRRWWKKEKIVVTDGYGLQYNLMARLTNTARHVGLNTEDRTTIADVMEQLVVPWRYVNDSWGFNYVETLQNAGESMVFNIMKPRRAGCILNLAKEIETKAWSAPGASNVLDPYGVPYWVVKNATTGFNGGYPSGHSTLAGVNLSNAPNFKNYTFQYVNVSKADAIKKLRTAHRLCQWISPVGDEGYRNGNGQKLRWYMNEATLSNFEDTGEAQNENLGKDVASMDGTITLRSLPCIYIPYLDSDTTNPIYGIDHSTFWPVVLKGMFLFEHDPIRDPLKHNWYSVQVDSAYNYVCVDRRRNIVGYV